MKKSILGRIAVLVVFLLAALPTYVFADPGTTVPDILTAEYGPPESANTWEKFTIPLTAETFGLDATTFNQAMQNIGLFRIRTEMHDGSDFGAVDNVKAGSVFSSMFDVSTENWNAMGDGTLTWESSGGVSGGYIKISDWATGDWHWAAAPESWQGDWSSLIGQNLEFYYMTNYPDYSAVVELHTSVENRVSLSANSTTLYPGGNTEVKVGLIPAPDSDVTVSLSSSNSSVVSVPSSVTVSASTGYAYITAEASASITEESSCVITASASGYSTSRLTLTVITAEGASLVGTVTDATNGDPIEGAIVSVAGLSDQTDSDGNYSIQNVPQGTLSADFSANPRNGEAPLTVSFSNQSSVGAQRVTASKTGYIDYVNNNVIIVADQENHLDISLSPELGEGNMRFVLNWDDDPRDLDSYLKTPEIGGSTHTVYYSNKGSSSLAPYATLDHDVRYGYGPETVTIHQMYSGTYYYYVHKYAGTQAITESNAVVQIYTDAGLLQTFQVPTSGDGYYWNVCEIDGATGQITVINQIQSSAPGAKGSAKGTQGRTLMTEARSLQPKESEMMALTYDWEFGDGQTSTDTDPVHTYPAPGFYTVSLTITDGVNTSVETKTDYIEVTGASLVETILLEEGFEDDVSDWIVIDNNDDDVTWGIYTEYAPYDTVAHSGEKGAGIPWASSGNDDYLITPPIAIPAGSEDVVLNFWSHSHSSTYPEDFDVKLSNSGTEASDFSTTLLSIRSAPLVWTEYEYDQLASYAGQTIYIAFHNISVDEYYQWLDDVSVIANIPTAVDENDDIAAAQEFGLIGNYPNPFNPETEIRFALPGSDFVTLEVFNMRGEKVRTLVQNQLNAGQHNVRFDASELPNGIYLYTLRSSTLKQTRKCLLLK